MVIFIRDFFIWFFHIVEMTNQECSSGTWKTHLQISEGSPPQGLSEARRGDVVSPFIWQNNPSFLGINLAINSLVRGILSVIDPPRGRPFGGGGVHHIGGMGVSTPIRETKKFGKNIPFKKFL
jgi:hypothetical protein